MQVFDNNPSIGRRQADQQQQQTLNDILRVQQDILEKLSKLERRFDSVDEAFVLNDLNKPDYHGHRSAHNEMMRSAKMLDGYKQDATKKVLGVLVAFILGLIATGFVEAVKLHLK